MRVALVLVIAAACGDGVPAPDAAPPADGPAGLVRVRYGGPERADQRVLFQAADSTIVLATRTDADGRANAYMAPGGFATLVIAGPQGPKIYTWAGVQPGDDLVIGDSGFVATAATRTVLFSIPAITNGNPYMLYTRCTPSPDSDSPIDVTPAVIAPTLEYLSDCGETADLLVVPNVPGYAFVHAAAVGGDATIAFPGPYQPLETSSVFVDRVPPDWDHVEVDRALVDHGVAYFTDDTRDAAVGPERMIANNVPFVTPPDATIRIALGPPQSFTGLSRLHAAHWGPPQSIERFDLGAVPLRPLTSRPVYDPAASTLRWTEGDGQLPDAALARLAWSRPELGGSLRWLIVAPRGEDPAIRLPVLPADLRPDLATPAIQGLATFAIAGGYDATRSHMLDDGAFDTFPVFGDAGDVITQELTQ